MTTSQSQALVLHAAGQLKLEQRQIPELSQGELLIKIHSTGLCGSDLHYFSAFANGPFKVQHPFVVGHESSGTVEAVGPGVSEEWIGKEVVMEPGRECRECRWCREGRYNLCPKMDFASSAKISPHRDGFLQQYIAHPTRLSFPLPPSLSLSTAVLVEPLSVILHALTRLNLHSLHGLRVAILGAGPVGLLAAAVLWANGCSVSIVDIEQKKLDLAIQTGWVVEGQGSIMPRKEGEMDNNQCLVWAQDAANDLKKTFGAVEGFDIVMECTGVESCLQTSIFLARIGGKVSLIGMGTSALYFPLGAAQVREVDLIGCFRYASCFPRAIELLASGALKNVEKLLTHTFPLEKTEDAFRLMRSGKDVDGNVVGKVAIRNN
ncbi:GroES-like protein [Atractiella rhizophila]|nr:GroES-like protein [Atractiella rhizophila]